MASGVPPFVESRRLSLIDLEFAGLEPGNSRTDAAENPAHLGAGELGPIAIEPQVMG